MRVTRGFAGATALMGLLIGATSAAAVNITIPDYNFPGGMVNTPVWGWDGGPAGQPFGPANEDNETEYNSARGQMWDLEAFAIDPVTPSAGAKLHMIGGYDLALGHTGGLPGHLFIKIGGPASLEPLSNPSGHGTVYNGVTAGAGYDPAYNYDYAIDLSGILPSNGGNVPALNVYDLNANSVLATVSNDSFGANPWKLWENRTSDPIPATGFDRTFATTGHYQKNLSTRQVGSLTGVTGLLDDITTIDRVRNPTLPLSNASVVSAGLTDFHHILTIDLSWLDVPVGTPVYFSYTMECGNDSLKGTYDGGFRQVPDGGTTAAMLGLGFAALSVAGRRLRRD